MIREIVREAWGESPVKFIAAVVATPLVVVGIVLAYAVFVEAAHALGIQ